MTGASLLPSFILFVSLITILFNLAEQSVVTE
nr:MAG TPA: hypothetical protein [Caudoviricetes sp.]